MTDVRGQSESPSCSVTRGNHIPNRPVVSEAAPVSQRVHISWFYPQRQNHINTVTYSDLFVIYLMTLEVETGNLQGTLETQKCFLLNRSQKDKPEEKQRFTGEKRLETFLCCV